MSEYKWPDPVIRLLEELKIEHPIIQAPMAGGPTTPELVSEVSNADALGSLGAGYLSPEMINAEIGKIREKTCKPYNVNFFIPEHSDPHQPSQNVLSKLEQFSREYEIAPPNIPSPSSYSFEEQLSVILDNKVPVFSFTFGIPDEKVMSKLREEGLFVIGTATCVEEGIMLEHAGCDAVVAQGSEAGGHRGSFTCGNDVPLIGGLALIPQLADKLKIPVIASGGIMDGRGIAAALALGAAAVQIGTAFLSTEEAEVVLSYREKLMDSNDVSTVITKTFSGKYARGIKNRFIEEMTPFENEVASYPIQNSLTRSIRNAAKDRNDAEFLSLWAGQGVAMSQRSTAKELVEKLVSETIEVFQTLAGKL